LWHNQEYDYIKRGGYGINMFRKTPLVGIIALFICIIVVPSITIGQVVEEPLIILSAGKTLYVGGDGPSNYTRIQDAIDNVSDGDIVFVFDDGSPYHENLTVYKSIQLIGENKDTTIIDADKKGSTIFITGNNVTVRGFTLQNSGDKFYNGGIELRSDDNLITDNIIVFNKNGVAIKEGMNNTVTNNLISHCARGIHPNIYYAAIFIKDSNRNHIIDNIIKNNDCSHGILLWGSHHNEIIGNEIMQNKGTGILLGLEYAPYRSSNNIISGNTIKDNTNRGIYIGKGINNKITLNTFEDDSVYIYLSKNTLICKNNFISCGSTFSYIFDEIKDYNNEWNSNYWDRPRYFPKLVKGEIGYVQGWGGDFFRYFRWYQIDWDPANEPYDIGI
jgi:parallel beta-helix repeat protein